MLPDASVRLVKVAISLAQECPTEGEKHSVTKIRNKKTPVSIRLTVESLNVSVASGVCLFEAVRQRLG